jgi:hypothetical protein
MKNSKEEPKQIKCYDKFNQLLLEGDYVDVQKDGQQYVDFSKHNADKITTASTTSAKIENKTLWKEMYSEEDMISFAEFVATYPDKNRNVNGEILHTKSKYDGSERTIDLLKQFKKK